MTGSSSAHWANQRFRIAVLGRPTSALAGDVLHGLRATPKRLPPKYFYDDRGSELFERICETDEYYQTRAELALLERAAPMLLAEAAPADLIELGSGGPRKARVLLRAAEQLGAHPRYIPFDVSEGALRKSAEVLLREFPWLEVHGTLGDYDHHLHALPRGRRRLFAFLGGTIGNFEADAARSFLSTVRRAMSPGDHLLLGTDLVKDAEVLHRAYNDAAGYTEAFNKNVLTVINRELGASFDPDAFRHVAFFDAERRQIEMHLEALRALSVRIEALDLDVHFEAGERLRTEISRKFDRAAVTQMLADAGLSLRAWYESPWDEGPRNENPARGFGLSVSQLL